LQVHILQGRWKGAVVVHYIPHVHSTFNPFSKWNKLKRGKYILIWLLQQLFNIQAHSVKLLFLQNRRCAGMVMQKNKQPTMQFQGKLTHEETMYSVFAAPTEDEDEQTNQHILPPPFKTTHFKEHL
jgi:hypothetical protein